MQLFYDCPCGYKVQVFGEKDSEYKIHEHQKTCPITLNEDFCKVMEDAKKDMVNHPPHYKQHPSGVECITVTEHFNFNVGNAIKYLWRSDHKNGLEDLKKAAWYVTREIQKREGSLQIPPYEQMR